VVVLSPSFFAKKWTQLELDGLFALEKPGEKRILPVWHNISASDVEKFSSFLAMRIGVLTSTGLDHVVTKLTEAIERELNPMTVEDDQPAEMRLHPHSIELLQAAKADGTILAVRDSGGFSVQAGGQSFGSGRNPRVDALNRHCINELVVSGLIERASEYLYHLTQEGYDFQPPAGVLDAPQPIFPKLSVGLADLGQKLMKRAVADDGHILAIMDSGGFTLLAGGLPEEAREDR
jgi:hypothetical protein